MLHINLLLPTHLRCLAADPAREDGMLTMLLRCPCGCMRFRLEEAVPAPAEQAAIDAWRAADKAARRGCIVRFRKDENGNTVLMRRRFPFGRWEPLKPLLPELPCYIDVLALRGICRSCGKTHLIYDNRVHGFDALSGEFTAETLRWQPQWREVAMTEDAAIRVDIPDDTDTVDMREFIPNFSPEMACDAFGYIEVWSETGGKRDELLFEAF